MSSFSSIAVVLACHVHLVPVASILQDTGCAAEKAELSLLQHGIQRATQDSIDEPSKGGYLRNDLPYDDHNDLEDFTYARKKDAAATSNSAGDSAASVDEKKAPSEPASDSAPAKSEAKEDVTTPPPGGLLQLEEGSNMMTGATAAFDKKKHTKGEPTEDSDDFKTDSPTTPGPERGDGYLEDDFPFDNHNALESASYALKPPAAEAAAEAPAETKEAPKAEETKEAATKEAAKEAATPAPK